MLSNLLKFSTFFTCLIALAGCIPEDCTDLEDLGLYECTFKWDTIDRHYVLQVPQSYRGESGESMPLVIDLHGYGSPVIGPLPAQRYISGLHKKAEEEGFIAIWPQGNHILGLSWSHILPQNYSGTSLDDAGFIVQIVHNLIEELNVDPSRVYVTGVSMGGGMAQSLACAYPGTFAAIASVSMTIPLFHADCELDTPIPVLAFHSESDWLIRYNGVSGINLNPGSLITTKSHEESFDIWSDRNECTDQPETTYEKNSAYCETRNACKDDVEVTYCTVDGEGQFLGGHLAYANNDDVNVTDMTWEFFSKYTRETD